MIFERGLEKHPKLVGMKRRLGIDEGRVFSILFRLWGHCEEAQRGMNWGKVDAEYVASVVEWDGDPFALYEALKCPAGKVVGGWIDVDRRGRLTVHGWEERNGRLLHNWNANKSGRPKGDAKETPRQPQGVGQRVARKAQGHPVEMSRDEISREVPPNPPEGGGVRMECRLPGSVEEVIEFGKTCNPPVSEERCRDFWAHYEGQKVAGPNGERIWRMRGGGIVTDWKVKLPRFGLRSGVEGGAGAGSEKFKNGEGGGKGRPAWAELKDVEEEIGKSPVNAESGWYRPGLAESDPERYERETEKLDGLKRRRKVLREKAAGESAQ